MIAVREIDHLVLRVSNAEAMLAFYRDVLDCPVERRQDDIGLIQLRAGRSLIDLVPVDGALGRAGGAAPGKEGRNLDHFCLRVDPFDEAAIRRRLAAHGIDAGSVASRYGAEGEGPSLYLDDPEGNVVELKGPPSARQASPNRMSLTATAERPSTMRLVGMLDSPYVRRVAVSLRLLGLDFEHEPLSVFSTFDRFGAINPVVKAPTLVCGDGVVLMDSSLILDYAEALVAGKRTLMPSSLDERRRALRIVGLALAACEKSVQIIYEDMVRPAEKRHAPWVDRITGQLLAACAALEAELSRRPLAAASASIGQDGVSAAVVWHFMQHKVADVVDASRHPAWRDFSAEAEALPEFRAAPHGGGSVVPMPERSSP